MKTNKDSYFQQKSAFSNAHMHKYSNDNVFIT